MYENLVDVEQQLRAYGVLLDHETIVVPSGKRKTCGPKKKCWYKTHEFRRTDGRVFVVGSFGTYSTTLAKTLGLGGEGWRKIEVDWKGISDEERERMAADRQAAQERERLERAEAQRWAAMSAAEIWEATARTGVSEYLQRKGVAPESCHFVATPFRLVRRDARDKPIFMPAGTLVLPLIRYDMPRESALRGLQFIKPDGFKCFTEGFGKVGCAIRLGTVDASTSVVLVCEGYATGLSIRMATGCRWPVYVALDAYNLAAVVEILRAAHPRQRLLICADDDWRSSDHDGPNPGRTKARKAAKATPGCDFVWPVFDNALREEKDTDFNDLHQRQGIEAVERQLLRVLSAIERGMALGR
jgi:putative DNA primase/helicase